MKKLTSILISILLASLLFISCGDKPSVDIEDNIPQNNENASVEDNVEKDDEGKENTDLPVIPPADEGDAVLFTAPSDYEIDYTFDGTEFAVFHIPTGEWTGVYGIIDLSGKVIIEPTYNLLGWCGQHGVLYADPFAEGDAPIYIDDTHKIDLHYGHGSGGSSNYIYSTASEKFYSAGGEYGAIYVAETATISEYMPYIITDISVAAGSYYDGDGSQISALLSAPSKEYAFVTDRGAEIMFEASYVQPRFVNGYMPIERGDKWGYIDLFGEDVSEFIYDGATNAHGDKAWVLAEGEWKVISLK